VLSAEAIINEGIRLRWILFYLLLGDDTGIGEKSKLNE
jgi:hypothetical protein